ncbi:hypothetical protein ABT203_34880 [Streptomyces sp900105245]|uniref:hypothetical protein n=1 Tax=Streptomyces sp. 900105245 TaxID=3154379 RepID=UPI0033341068
MKHALEYHAETSARSACSAIHLTEENMTGDNEGNRLHKACGMSAEIGDPRRLQRQGAVQLHHSGRGLPLSSISPR